MNVKVLLFIFAFAAVVLVSVSSGYYDDDMEDILLSLKELHRERLGRKRIILKDNIKRDNCEESLNLGESLKEENLRKMKNMQKESKKGI